MSRSMSRVASLIVILLALAAPSVANPIVINFDSLSDSAIITNQFSGVTFSNALALKSGLSLNELEFPPFSGSDVASDNGGPMRIDFAQPVSSVGGYFTYAEPLTLRAFNASNSLLGSILSPFSSNEALSGDLGSSPNEFLLLAFNNISYVTFAGDPLGGSFTLDDLTYTNTLTTAPVPEPGTLGLVLLCGIGLMRSWRATRGF
jgi:hypothetical protein